MKKGTMTCLLSLLLMSVPALAQDDDMYYVPKSKAQKQADKKEQQQRVAQRYDYEDDIVYLDEVEGVYPDTLFADSLEGDWQDVGESGSQEEDYTYTRRMSRFDGYMPFYTDYYPWYDWWYDPWYYRYRSYHAYWRNAYWGWYDPWYNDYFGFYTPYYSHWSYPYRDWAWRPRHHHPTPHFGTGRTSFDGMAVRNSSGRYGRGAGFGNGRTSFGVGKPGSQDVRKPGSQLGKGARTHNGSFSESRLGRRTSTLNIPQQSGTVTTGSRNSWNTGNSGSSGNSGGFSRSGGFGGSRGGGSFSGGGSRGGGFGGRR